MDGVTLSWVVEKGGHRKNTCSFVWGGTLCLNKPFAYKTLFYVPLLVFKAIFDYREKYVLLKKITKKKKHGRLPWRSNHYNASQDNRRIHLRKFIISIGSIIIWLNRSFRESFWRYGCLYAIVVQLVMQYIPRI